jgi:GR25 family glycosyltransferase involved in LPS biosynthesis
MEKMKAFVITVENIEESVQAAERCINSASQNGFIVNKHFGITPEDDPVKLFKDKGLPTKNFENNKYSRYERCLSAFLSHRSLWELCAADKRNYLILEHDAIINNALSTSIMHGNEMIVSLGEPSYGKYNTPQSIGIGPLVSKQYFPGAHAYVMSPKGAKAALEKSLTDAAPTDIFFNNNNFPWLKEFYPWPISVKENFTTIQKTEGCLAKHGYSEGYSLL